ncbi:Zinc finger BED domain-containing protein RICESLEEPER 2 [Euphorbia peplus]|nr:Zinc finger BED domain-containing protein RICESLEEPER 2 [Euphorbia peplus]
MRVKLARMIIIDELPFSIVEYEGFIDYSYALQPRFIIPSHTTVARDCLKLFADEKEKLKRLLTGQRVCLTTDTWTSIQNLNYLCLTAHWIDSNWKLHKKILSFCPVANHKGLTLGKTIESCLLDWDIDQIFTITVDNASSNDTAIRYLKNETRHWKGTILGHDYIHVRCCAHILNLIVKDGLKDLDDSIVRIRDVVRYVRLSPSRLQFFKRCVEKCKIESKSLLCLDVETRWNSTYKMLEAAEKFEKAFMKLEGEDSKYLEHFDSGPPNVDDWKNAKCFIKFLKLFYNATLKFSGSLFVTSNTFFHEIMSIQSVLHRLFMSQDELLSVMAFRMQVKFDKY